MGNIKFLLISIITFIISNLQYTYSQSEKKLTNIKTVDANLVNTTWSGTDSDGDFYEYTFLEGGKINYKTNTSRDTITEFISEEKDLWVQNGNIIIIILGDCSVQRGIIKENTIEGIAWNSYGKKWTWSIQKIKK